MFGQLIRENNKALDKTFIYSYNEIGNISSVSEYAYTTEATPSGTASTKSYGYDLAQPDRLFLLGLKRITYDSLGYVKTYDGWTYTWDKGRLVSMQKSTQPSQISTYTFTYDAYGRRTQKKYTYTPGSLTQVDYIKTETTSYTYDNSGRLVNERCVSVYDDNSTETHEFTYLYDESGIIGTMFSKNGATATPYYYRRNLQGDVTAIYNQSGTKVAEYAYDAWGNCTVTNSGDFSIAYTNPILYRGYYYDRSTGLYYLNARYYNPQWRRFISPDSTDYLDPESVNGLNLYAYCNNDPVNYADPSGHAAILTAALILMGVGIIAGLGYAAYTDCSDDSVVNGSVGWQTYVGSAMIGGAIGFGIGYFGPSVASFLGSSFSFTLPSFGALNMGGALAFVGGTTITVTGAQIVGGAIGISVFLFSLGADRYKPKNTGSNTSQNEFIDYLQNKYGFSDKLRRRLHDIITKRGYSNKKVEEILRKMMGLD